jgi:hypothetical protein
MTRRRRFWLTSKVKNNTVLQCYSVASLLFCLLSPCTVHSAFLHPATQYNTNTLVLRSTEVRFASTEPVSDLAVALAALAGPRRPSQPSQQAIAGAIAGHRQPSQALARVLEVADKMDEDYQEFRAETAGTTEWECKFLFKETTSPNGKDGDFVDLCDYMAYDYNSYKFPARYNGLDQKDTLLKELKHTAMASGFNLIIHSSSEKKPQPKGSMVKWRATLGCQYGRLYQSSTDKNTDHNKENVMENVNNGNVLKENVKTSTSRAKISEKLCGFKFNILLFDEPQGKYANCWFLTGHKDADSLTCRCHKFHPPMKADQLHQDISLMSEEDKNLFSQCNDYYIVPSTCDSLLTECNENGGQWKTSQMAYLQRQLKKSGVAKLETADDDTNAARDAMIDSLSPRNDVSYVYVTFHPSQGLLLLTNEARKEAAPNVLDLPQDRRY